MEGLTPPLSLCIYEYAYIYSNRARTLLDSTSFIGRELQECGDDGVQRIHT